MKTTFIVLQGNMNAGKSSTIRELYSLFQADNNWKIINHIQHPHNEIEVVIEHLTGIKIGCLSFGDPGQDSFIKKYIENFISIQCKIIVCATRANKKERNHKYINSLLKQYNVISTTPYSFKSIEDPSNCNVCNDLNKLKAQHIKDLIEKIINQQIKLN